MQTIEYATTDKSEWPVGPWQSEPDKKQWLDKATDLPCLIVRGPVGALCGYVGVPKGHPAYGLHYDGIPQDKADERSDYSRENMRAVGALQKNNPGMRFEDAMAACPHDWPEIPRAGLAGEAVYNVEIHGGLTFSGADRDGDEATTISHVPEIGDPDDIWWFGFDCSHFMDYMPKLWPYRTSRDGESYRDFDYVTKECENLAKQLKAIV